MDSRTLGTEGLEVAEIGYGAMGTVFAYGPSDDSRSVAAIRRAYESGVTMFDTAELYGWGDGERLLGRAVAPFRDDVVIATKFGLTPDGGRDSRPEHIRDVVENSLRHLDTSTIDLLYQHAPDPEVPVEDVVGTMRDLVREGKVQYLGLSNAPADDIRRGHAVHPISAVQNEYSLFARESEELFATLDQLGIGFVPYSPLARGFLGGAVQPGSSLAEDDVRRNLPWWADENFDENVDLTRRLEAVAESKGIALGQLALAWLLARGSHIVPIPGARDPARVTSNVSAADFRIGDDLLRQLDQIAPDGGIGGRG